MRGIRVALTIAVAGSVLIAPVALARDPISSGGDDPSIQRPLTSAEQAANAWKDSQAAALDSRLHGQSAAACPFSQTNQASTDCTTPSRYAVNAYARQESPSYYCGPAAAQVIINRTRNYFYSNTNGGSTSTNYKTQATIGTYIGTTSSSGTSSYQLEDGLNHYADTSATGTNIPFTVYTTGSGADFHERVILATFNWDRGLGIPIQMTYTSYHLSSWRNSTWWSSHQGITIKHWLVGYGYNGFWDGTTGPQVLFDDSSGGLGGSTGAFTDPSIDVYDLNYANSKRVVY